jgi:orotate phosphoribosyltransferase
MAAKDYFEQVGKEYGDPVLAPVSGITREQLQASGPVAAISTIARSYLIHGGIARDNGLSGERKIVRYYINLMAAVTNHDYLDVLAAILAERIRNLKLPGNPKIVGLKKGNSILAYTVAQRLQAPIALFKTDMSYKIGSPFDGSLEEGDDVIIVDDIASDASMLMNAIRNLLLHKVYVKSVVTLIERKEGDARTRIWREKNVPLSAVCKADDDDIHKLIIESKNLPAA